jgi:O-antigen ligase
MDIEANDFATKSSCRAFCVLLIAIFVGTELFSYSEVEFILYFITLVGGAFYVYRHPSEGIWITFFLLAVTSLLYPLTVGPLGEPEAGQFRPYNLALASLAGAMVFGMRRRRRTFAADPLHSQSGTVKLVVALAGVFCLATVWGDLSPFRAGALYVLQQCSAWSSFFLFLWIGYRLVLSPADMQRAHQRFHLAAVVYSVVFLAKFAYLNYYEDLTTATNFAWAQRTALFFAGCSLVLTFARRLAHEGGPPTKGDWLSALVVVPAVVLSGSRGVAGAVFFTVLIFAALWRSRSLLRLTPLLLAFLLIGVVILHSNLQVVEEYVVSRFLITPDQDASFAGRVAEMEAVIEAVQRNPVWGSGTLASYTFFDPLFGWRESSFVDNGVGYLLLKTGLLGTSVFVLLVLSYLKVLRHLRQSVAADALIPLVVFVFYLAFLPFGPSFFDPRFSWLVGIQCGYSLYLNKIYCHETSLWATEMGVDGNPSCRSHA